MRKFFSLIAAVLFAGSMMAEEATMTAGTNGSACTVNDVAGIKCGTSKAGGDMTITVGKGATALTFYAAAWNNVTDLSLNITAPDGVTVTPASVALTMDPGISNNSPFTLTGDEENFKCEFVLAGVEAETTLKLEGSAAKRFVVWGATYETGEVPPTPTMNYYVTGNMTNWGPQAAYMLTPDNGLYKGEFTFAANDQFKVTYSDGTTIDDANWFPGGMDNNYVITEAGDYAITFNPAGNVEGWYEGYFQVAKKEALPDPTNCAEAAEAALSVENNNDLYNDGKVYTIEGYVTSIATDYSDTYHNISFWMADERDGGNVLQAFRAACESAEAAPGIGDKVAVTGKLTKHNTTPEFASGCTFEIIEKSPVVPQNLGEKTIAEFLELKNFVDTCILTGTVANVKNNEYGNFDLVELGNAEVSVYVYGLLTAEGEAKKCFAEENIAEGDTLKVLAIYTEYNAAPQVKNAIFVEVKHLPVIADTIVIDIEEEVEYIDQVAAQGWWQFIAENEDYEISISNVSTTQAAGVYGIEDLDADYTYVTVKATETDVYFEDGEFTLTEGEDGSRTIVGLMTGDDGNIYDIKLVYTIPTAKTTVNVEIPEWGVADASEYYGLEGYIFYGEAEDGTYVQIVIPGSNPLGQFTYEDCYTGGTGIEVDGEFKSIYSMDLNVSADAEQKAIITVDFLCLNNTLYHVTTAGALQGVNNVEAAQKAIKSIMNGQLVIEKNGKTFNAAGQMLK